MNVKDIEIAEWVWLARDTWEIREGGGGREWSGGAMLLRNHGGTNHGGTIGFSLVELLTVLAVLALAASLILVTLPDSRGNLDSEGARLTAHITTLRQVALQEGRFVALRLEGTAGYGFDWRDHGRWQPIPLIASHRLPTEITIRLSDAVVASPSPVLPTIFSSPPTLSSTVALRRARGEAEPSRIIFDSLGMTGQTVDIILRAPDEMIVIHLDVTGEPQVDFRGIIAQVNKEIRGGRGR